MTNHKLNCSYASHAPKRRRLENHREGEQRLIGATISTVFAHGDYTVVLICPLLDELAVSRAMLDEIYNSVGDDNTYTPGQIGHHIIAIGCAPLWSSKKGGSKPTTANPNTIATLSPLSGAESLSLTGDPKLQAAILK